MPSFLSRLCQATRVLMGRDERSIPPGDLMYFTDYGRPANFKPEASLSAYGDNAWLYGAVSKVAQGDRPRRPCLQTEVG
jgi:hypothetical protein